MVSICFPVIVGHIGPLGLWDHWVEEACISCKNKDIVEWVILYWKFSLTHSFSLNNCEFLRSPGQKLILRDYFFSQIQVLRDL